MSDEISGQYCFCARGGGMRSHVFNPDMCEKLQWWKIKIKRCITLKYYGFTPLPRSIIAVDRPIVNSPREEEGDEV